jgi:arylsulfatase A-like enzyme
MRLGLQLALLLLLGDGCGSRTPEALVGPNLLLISIDSLRADRLGCYGAERATSPAIDRLCARGVRFTQAVAPTSWTLPSHVTLLTGLPIPAHGVDAPEDRIDPERQLLAQHLRGVGYRTAGFVSAPFLQHAYGFDRGFERYENLQGATTAFPPDREAHVDSHADETAPQVVARALDWLRERPVAGEPWFLFVHLWDVHYDYVPPSPYDRMFDPDYEGDLDVTDFEHNPAIALDMAPRDLEHLRARYDGEIRWLDGQLAPLLAEIEARDEQTVLALVADHGEEFFEHGKKGHFRNLFETSVRVPFILVHPGTVEPGSTVDAVVGLDDVAPTLLGLAGLPAMDEAMGRDLSDHLRGGPPPLGAKLLTLHDLSALRGDGWKVVRNRRTGFAVYYDLEQDPGEQDPKPARRLAAEQLALLEAREAAVAAHAEGLTWSDEHDVELDAELRERLRELGYVE